MVTKRSLSYEAPSGPYPVGVCDGEVTDSRYPVIRTEDTDGRRLMVRAWYPTPRSEGRHRMYFEGAELDVLTSAFSVSAGDIFAEWLQRLAELQTYSYEGAPVAEGKWPALIFSHGGGMYVSQNTPLMEHLASHGYVVWSVAHPGEAAAVLYSDGTVARLDPRFMAASAELGADPAFATRISGDIPQRLEAHRSGLDDKGLGPWAARWRDDKVAVVDALEHATVTGAAAAAVLACDLNRIGLFGMSFGGAAAVSAAQRDGRVNAAVNLDGGQFLSDVLDADVRVPLLALSSDMFVRAEAMGMQATLLDWNEFFFEPLRAAGLRPHVHRLLVPGLTHGELLDLVLLPAEERAATMPPSGKLDGQHVVNIVNTFVCAHFDHALKGIDNGYPDRQLEQFPEVVPIDMSPIREWAAQLPV